MKKIIFTKQAPTPIGPYSQAVLTNNTLYISGQIALNVETGLLINNDIKAETHQIMKNLGAILNAAEMNFSNIVKCSIFITDMASFSEINDVYGSYFSEQFPARETIQVAKLPMNVNVEISAIAVK